MATVHFFSLQIDPETNSPFFHSKWKTDFKRSVGYIQQGYLSDPPNLSMYTRLEPVSEQFGLYRWRCHRGTSALEGYHLFYRTLFHPTALSMGPRFHELTKNQFDFRWNVDRTRESSEVSPEVKTSHHYDLWLFDIIASSVRRVNNYGESESPLHRHRLVDTSEYAKIRGLTIDTLLTYPLIHHSPIHRPLIVGGFYHEGVVVRSRRGLPPPPLSERPPVTSTSLEYVNWLFGSKATRVEPTKQQINMMSKIENLWKDSKLMQDFALKSLDVMKDSSQWSLWISRKLCGHRTSSELNKSKYKSYFKSVCPTVVSSSGQQQFSVPQIPDNLDPVHSPAVPLRAFVGTGGKLLLNSESRITENNSTDDVVTRSSVSSRGRSQSSVHRNRKKTCVRMKLHRSDPVVREKRNLRRRVSRLKSKYTTMSEEICTIIAQQRDYNVRKCMIDNWEKNGLSRFPVFLPYI